MTGGVPSVTGAEVSGEIHRMVERIVERFHPDKVILFGSHARGTAGPDSDVDLLVVMPVVMPVEGSRRKQAAAIDGALIDRRLPLDLIVVTPEELDSQREQVGTVVRPAVREGIVLYQRIA